MASTATRRQGPTKKKELKGVKGVKGVLQEFDIEPGNVICDKYEVTAFLGGGWEGEVYLVEELATGIERAAKFFYPHRNQHNRVARSFAQKLYRNRDNPALVQYLNQEKITIKDHSVTCLISEFIDGELLQDFIDAQPGKRIPPYMALHILWAITEGLEKIHHVGEYHGDLHTGNIIIKRQGIHFKVKLLDPFDWQDSKTLNIRKDMVDLVRILYDMCGGRKHYSNLGPEIKSICCGLKTSVITKKFRNAAALKGYLQGFSWEF